MAEVGRGEAQSVGWPVEADGELSMIKKKMLGLMFVFLPSTERYLFHTVEVFFYFSITRFVCFFLPIHEKVFSLPQIEDLCDK